MSVSTVVGKIGVLIEGPHWDDDTQTLLFVNIHGPSVHRWNPATNEHHKVVLKDVTTVGTIVPDKYGGLVVSADRNIARLDFDSGELTVLAKVDTHKPRNMINDGKCDAAGRFWIGTVGPPQPAVMFERNQGSLYSVESDHNVVSHCNDISLSNGLAWSNDNKLMYYIDSFTNRVDVFDFDLDYGVISNRRTCVNIPESEGLPDGMTMDSEGKLWVAMFYGSQVIRIDPGTGTILRRVKFPAKGITSCCFGGANLDELYVTSASYGFSEEELASQPLAGSLFKVTGLGNKGRHANTYWG
ncbi:regucalcin-like [Glandiceps talaboti]